MNGIISIYSEDIRVNNLDAENIETDNIQINNSMTVNNITLSPIEVSQLTGVNVDETLQQQINSIETDLSNTVDLDSNQDIGGTKNFTDTLKITGVMNVNSTDITALELSFSSGLIGNIQQQIDAVDTTGYMDLVTEQTATALKNFSASIQTPSIFNEEVTGQINGYFSDASTLLYTSKSGTFAVGSSVISGIDCVNKTLTSLTTSPNVASISPDTTVRKSQIYTYQGYITSGNQVYTITTTGLQANQGIQFTGVSDFIGSISGHLITLLNTTGLTPSSITLETSIVQIGANFYFNTEDNYSLQRFVENANLTPPTLVNSEPYTNLYSLLYPAGNPVDTFNRQITGFNYNNRIYSSDTVTKLDMYILDNLTTTGANDTPYGSKLNTEIAGTDLTIYGYSLPPTNQTSQGNLSGFYDGGLFVFDTTLLSSPSTQAVLSNGTDYQAFTSSIDADNEVQLSYSRLQTTASTTVNSYVKDLTGTPFLLSPSSQTGKYVNHNTISLVGNYLGGFSYTITSPNTIIADLGGTFLNVINYSPNATTLIFRNGFSQLNTNDWYELSSAYGFYITGEPQNNYIFTSTNNTADISPTTDITGCIIVNYLGGGLTFLFGTSSASNSSLSNTIYAPINNVCYTSNTTSFNNTMTKARTFNNQFNPLNYQQPINGGTPLQFITRGNVYYCNTSNPSDYQANDIFEYQDTGLNTNNVSQTGKTIIAPLGQTVATALYGFYIGTTVADSPTYASASPTQNLFQYYANYVYMVAIASIFTGLQPQANDFIRFKDFNGTYSFTYITSVVYVPPVGGSVAYYKLYTNFYNSSWTEYRIEGYFYRPDSDFIDIYRPQTFKKYTTRSSITIYNQQKKYYTPELYNVFNQQTTNLFDTITTTNQFINEPLYFYSNNQYNALTSVEIDLPATAIPDEFTVNTFAQTLSNKTFSNDTVFQQDIEVVDVRASGNIDCLDLTATGNIDCVDLTGSGLLTMTDLTKEHNISNVFIGRQFSTTSDNYGLSIGSSQTTLNNFVITRNVANNITVINSIAEVWTNVNNQLRLKVGNQSIEFYPANNLRFIINNASTTIYKTDTNAKIDAFASNSDCFIDFQTSGTSDYAVRLNTNYGGTTNGRGTFNITCNRMNVLYSDGVRQLEMGYLSFNTTTGERRSFLKGTTNSTYIIFSTNTEIYYLVNGTTRFTMASNGVFYAQGFVNTSDRRLKNNIVDVSGALQTINTLQVKEFYKKCSMCCDEDGCEETIHQIGFIAQDVQQTDLSFCVSHSQLNDTLGIESETIFALGIKGIQELYAMVLQQKELLEQQQNEINILKERLSYLNV